MLKEGNHKHQIFRKGSSFAPDRFAVSKNEGEEGRQQTMSLHQDIVAIAMMGTVEPISFNPIKPQSKWDYPRPEHYLQRRQAFVHKMEQLGLEVIGFSWPFTAEWLGQEQDFQRLQQLESLLNNGSISDDLFRQYVRADARQPGTPCIENWLAESSFFARLGSKNQQLTSGNTITPFEHILLVQELLSTQALEENNPLLSGHPIAELKSLLRWTTFFHDLGKVIDPADAGHGVGSAIIAHSYFEWRRAQAAKTGRSLPWSDQFCNRVIYMCEHHHLFAELVKFLSKELQLNQGRVEALKTRQPLVLDQFYSWYLARQDHRQHALRLPEFKTTFAELAAEPVLAYLLYLFTQADVGSNREYHLYLTQNSYLWEIVEESLIRAEE